MKKKEQIKVEENRYCVACGKPIILSHGRYKDFCSVPCLHAGRVSCLQCGKILQQSDHGPNKDFCNDTCNRRFRNAGPSVSPSYWEERYRTTCKMCKKPITQPKQGGRQFCNATCSHRYYHTKKLKLSYLEKWGSYASDTRKVLKEIEESGMPGLAKRLAAAIDREYMLRRPDQIKSSPRAGIDCICTTCGKEFRRKSWAHRSREYCDDCQKKERAQIKEQAFAKLSWDDVVEIRYLHDVGVSQRKLAEKYNISETQIYRIVDGISRKEPYAESGEKNGNAKLTWENVDEIRRLHEIEHLSSDKLAKKFGVGRTTIKNIFNYKAWKPEHDPRKQVQS